MGTIPSPTTGRCGILDADGTGTALFGAQLWVALIVAITLIGFYRVHGRPYLREWSFSMFALSVFLAGSVGAMMMSATVPVQGWPRLVTTAVSLIGAYWHLVWLVVATRTITDRGRTSTTATTAALAGAAVLAVIAAVAYTGAPFPSNARFFMRVGLRGVVTGAVFFGCAWFVLRARSESTVGRRLLGIALAAQGLLSTYAFIVAAVAASTGASWWLGPSFQHLGIIVYLGMGIGMVTWLLEEERGHVLRVWQEHQQTEEARRESEERFRQVAEAIDAVFWIRRSDTLDLIYLSPAYERVWGRPRQEAYDHSDAFTEAVHPGDRQRVLANLRGQWSTEHSEEFRIVRPDGTTRWIHSRSFPVRGPNGSVSRIAGLSQDVTERRASEQKQRLLETQVRQTQKMEALGTLAGGIAHDFNNLLLAIIGYTELSRSAASGGAAQHLDQVLAAAQRASNLVDQILTFARGSGLELHPVDIAEVVRESLDLMHATVPKSIEFREEIDPDAGAVRANPGQIQQVVANLVTNAAASMPDGGELVIELTGLDATAADLAEFESLAPGPYVRLRVRDQGIGMDADTIARMFDPFFTTKAVGKGSGLGLSVVLGIVQSHEGDIRVDSRLGLGTTIDVLLPRTTEKVVSDAHKQPELQRGTGRILLVDDEPQVADIVRHFLTQAGYTVRTFTSSPDALAAFRDDQRGFDLILTDQTMPKLSGVQLAAAAHALRADIPIILMSGHGDVLSNDRFESSDLATVIAKPFELNHLAEVVNHTLRMIAT